MIDFHPRFARSASLLALTALLAACGSQPSTTVPNSTALVPVTLSTESLAGLRGAELQPQGVPFNPDGSPAVQSVHVQVFNKYVTGGPNTPLRFDEAGHQDPKGSRDYIELTSAKRSSNYPDGPYGVSSAEIYLAPGTYDFEAIGLTTNTEKIALAYQLLAGQQIGGAAGTFTKNQPLLLHLKTILGKASLEPTSPVTAVYPGQELDLKLVVQTPEVAGGKRYDVPLSDFEFLTTPTPGSDGTTVVHSSKLGERIKISPPDPGQTEVTLTQLIRGLTGATPGLGTLPVSFSRPYAASTTIGVDLGAPEFFVNVSYGDARPPQRTIGRIDVGLPSDAFYGSFFVDFYEGVELVGSFLHKPGDNGTFFLFNYSIAHKFTIVVTDPSGNESRQTVETTTWCGDPVSCE